MIRESLKRFANATARRLVRLRDHLRECRVLLIDPKTGQSAVYTPDNDTIDMGDSRAYMSDIKERMRLDPHFNPLEDTGCVLWPCRKCMSLTCARPEEHFGISYDEFFGTTDPRRNET